MKKRLLALFMSLCLLVSLLPTSAWAAEDEDGTKEHPWNVSAEGENNHVTAYLEQNDDNNESPTYTLTITGSGAMKDFTFSQPGGIWKSSAPWHSKLTADSTTKRYPITALEIGDEITHIGSAAFASLDIEKISFKQNVTSYGAYVFITCTAVTDVDWTDFNSNIETIPEGLLYGCMALTTFKDADTTSGDGELLLPTTITGI